MDKAPVRRRSACALLVLTAALFGAAQAVPEKSASWRPSPEVSRIFSEAGVTGTFVVCRVPGGVHTGHDHGRAQTRFVPASTFKIPNTLFALETGVVAGPEEMFAWGGEPRWFEGWEKDMTFAEALRVSNVNVYQEVARQIGLERMRDLVAAFDYGNRRIGDTVDTFWLQGPLAISAVEQCGFLLRLANGELPVSDDAVHGLRDTLASDEGEETTLYAKTGWAHFEDGMDIGWWVGWVEGPFGRAAFALNIDMPDRSWVPRRIEIGRAALRELGFLPSAR